MSGRNRRGRGRLPQPGFFHGVKKSAHEEPEIGTIRVQGKGFETYSIYTLENVFLKPCEVTYSRWTVTVSPSLHEPRTNKKINETFALGSLPHFSLRQTEIQY